MNLATTVAWIACFIIAALLFLGLLFDPMSLMSIISLLFHVAYDLTETVRKFVEAARNGCKSFFLSHTRHIPHKDGSADSGPVLWFVSRSIYLGIALLLVTATALLDILRANAVQFDNAGGKVPLPALLQNVTLLNGVIWVTLILFWGIIILDVFEIAPPYARLLYIEDKTIKIVVRILALVGGLLLVLVIGLMYYLASLATHRSSWPGVPDFLALFQGVLINFAGFLALIAVMFGLVVVVLLIDAILVGVLALLDVLLSGIGKLWYACSEALVRGIAIASNALRSIWNVIAKRQSMADLGMTYLPRIEIGPDGSITTGATFTQLGQTPMSSISSMSSIPPTSPAGFPPHDVVVEADGSPPASGVAQAVLLGIGSDAISLLKGTLDNLKLLEMMSQVLAAGISPLGAESDNPLAFDTSSLGIGNVSVSAARISEARAGSEDSDTLRKLLIEDLMINAESFCLHANRVRGQILIFLTLESAHLLKDALIRLHGALDQHIIGVIATAPPLGFSTSEMNAALQLLADWHKDGYIAGSIIIDPQSPLARHVGPAQQERLLSKTLASMIGAPATENNSNVGKIFVHMGQVAPYMVYGLSSTPISTGRQLTGWWVLNSLFNVPKRGSGNTNSARAQAHRLIEQLLGEKTNWTVDLTAIPPKSAQLVSIVMAPLRASDRRWKQYKEQMTSSLRAMARHMRVIFVSGNGVADNTSLERNYYVQVALLAGMQNVQVDTYGVLYGQPAAYRQVDEDRQAS